MKWLRSTGPGVLCFRKHGCDTSSGAVIFYNMPPSPELYLFITWLRFQLRSCSALLIHFNNSRMPSVLFVASDRIIPTYFELILLPLPGLVVGVGRSLF